MLVMATEAPMVEQPTPPESEEKLVIEEMERLVDNDDEEVTATATTTNAIPTAEPDDGEGSQPQQEDDITRAVTSTPSSPSSDSTEIDETSRPLPAVEEMDVDEEEDDEQEEVDQKPMDIVPGLPSSPIHNTRHSSRRSAALNASAINQSLTASRHRTSPKAASTAAATTTPTKVHAQPAAVQPTRRPSRLNAVAAVRRAVNTLVSSSQITPTKRRRGRPPKPKTESDYEDTSPPPPPVSRRVRRGKYNIQQRKAQALKTAAVVSQLKTLKNKLNGKKPNGVAAPTPGMSPLLTAILCGQPLAATKTGRPKGRPRKLPSLETALVGAASTETSPDSGLRRTTRNVGRCDCDTKYRQILAQLEQTLETRFKEQTLKLRRDIEMRDNDNIRLTARIVALNKEIELLKRRLARNEEGAYDAHDADYRTKKHREELEQAKRTQWCSNCLKESIYFCCWNTTYCSLECQQQHWHSDHKRNCRRKKERLREFP